MNKHWQTVALGEVLELDLDKVEVSSEKLYDMVGVYSFGKGLFFKEAVQGIDTSYKHFFRIKPDHIIMSQLFGWEGALALSSEKYAGRFLSSQFPTFLCNPEKLDRHFLGWLMKRPAFWQDLGTRAKGMGDRRRTLNPDSLLKAKVTLPPLTEQRRIVARIEALAAKVEEAKRLRKESIAEIEHLSVSFISDVFDKHKETLGTLANGITLMKNGYSIRPEKNEKGVIVLRLADVSTGKIDLSNARRGDLSDSEMMNYGLSEGDLLFVRVNGSFNIVGRCIPVISSEEKICFNDHLINVTVNPSVFNWKYVAIMMNSPLSRKYIENAAISTAGQKTINQKMLQAIPIPIPSIREQNKIVTYLDNLQTKVDALKKHQAETQQQLNALLPAILDKAFKGEL